jgi:hypothetical protein
MRHWWASLCNKRFVGHENAIQNAPCNRPLKTKDLKSQSTKLLYIFVSGVPGEVAYFGFLFPVTWMVASSLALLTVGNLFIPIFYKMNLTSVYEVRERERERRRERER